MQKWTRPETPPPLWTKSIQMFFFFFFNFPKLVERTVQVQMQQHFERYKLFHHNGHAYRPSKSTTTALMQTVDQLYQATDSNLMSSLLALDQSAAFDSVSHDILLRKLSKYKMSKDTIKWVSSYLRHRTQYIKIGRHSSRMSSLERGVPQGSILGPLLYLIYTNELASVITDSSCNNVEVHSDRKMLFGKKTATNVDLWLLTLMMLLWY